jgi:hypothetical protein
VCGQDRDASLHLQLKLESNVVASAPASLPHMTRVARWYIFQTKNPNLAQSWRVLQWKISVYLHNVHLVYFMAIWHILCLFGIFFPVLVCYNKKNLASLHMTGSYIGHISHSLFFPPRVRLWSAPTYVSYPIVSYLFGI